MCQRVFIARMMRRFMEENTWTFALDKIDHFLSLYIPLSPQWKTNTYLPHAAACKRTHTNRIILTWCCIVAARHWITKCHSILLKMTINKFRTHFIRDFVSTDGGASNQFACDSCWLLRFSLYCYCQCSDFQWVVRSFFLYWFFIFLHRIS